MAILRSAVREWDRFWFTPQDPLVLGLLRILSGSMLVYTHAVWGLQLDEFFGPAGWQDELLVRVQQAGSPAWSMWWFVPPDWLHLAHGACVVVLTLYTCGVCTRLTSLAAFVIVVSYAHRAMNANFGLDQINTLLTFYLMLGPSGHCLSFDSWWEKFRQRRRSAIQAGPSTLPESTRFVSAQVATRLLQLHVCLVYAYAGLAKLKGDAWWDGTAIWLAAVNTEYQTGDLTWLAWYPWLGNMLTHLTVIWELSFLFLVWKPGWRPVMLQTGICVHSGIGAFLGMWTFGLVMIITYLSFLPPETLRAALNQIQFHRPSPVLTTGRMAGVMAVCGLWLGGSSGCAPGPTSSAVHLERGRFYLSRGEPEQAINAFTKAIDARPLQYQLYYERARAHEMAENLPAAQADYSHCIELQPGFALAHNNLGTVLARLNRLEDAVQAFTRAIELNPADSLALNNRSLAHFDLGHNEQGLADSDRAIELDPGTAEPWVVRGNLTRQAGLLEEAIRSYKQALFLNPQHALARWQLSQAYDQAGQNDLAAAERRRALEIDPELAAVEAPAESAPTPVPAISVTPDHVPDTGIRPEK